MVLRGLQSLLERLYDVEPPYDVDDFLVTDRREVSCADPENDRRAPDEELLLAETADGAGVALYLDPDVLQRLEAANPHQALTEENLADYCTALEGVSHFVYSTWRLDRDSPVSLLELETQAEVDKYAVTVFLLARQQGSHSYPAPLRSCQFRCAPRARSVRTLPNGASLRRELLPPPGTAIREQGRGENRGDGARIARFLSPEARR